MKIPFDVSPSQSPITFEEFATDHAFHRHCDGCGSCLLDPEVQHLFPLYCVTCAIRVIEQTPKGAILKFDIEHVRDVRVREALQKREAGL